MSLTINGLVVLGTAVPEQLKDGRKTVCLAGWNKELGFVRVYPCAAEMGLHRWDILNVTVEGNSRDSRFESWKLVGKPPIIEKVGKIEGEAKRGLLEATSSPCVVDINNKKLSLGVIAAQDIAPQLTKNTSFSTQGVFSDFATDNRWLKSKSDFPYQPKLRFRCGKDCKSKHFHFQSVVEWGAFEWARKNPDKIKQLFDNWKINNPNYDIFFLVGNLYQHRNSFIIISVISFKKRDSNNCHLFNLPTLTDSNKQFTLQRRVSLAIMRNSAEITKEPKE
jgi:hypothetical protein